MGAPRVAVVDYRKGNLTSVERGLAAAGADAFVTQDPGAILAADAAVIPGVGAFEDAMAFLRSSGEDEAVRALVGRGAPVLGICLGMQLLFERGCERARPPEPGEPPVWTPGLGLLAGEVARLEPRGGAKVPHVGWNSAELTDVGRRCPLFADVPDGTYFYFTHSYACRPADASRVAATTDHGGRFTSAVWDGGALFGCQWHPEKSSAAGARVLESFVRMAGGEGL